ncbi:MAG: S8 family peptidase [Vulcanimicrobiota bacterium]
MIGPASDQTPKTRLRHVEGEVLVRLQPGAGLTDVFLPGEILHQYRFPAPTGLAPAGNLVHVKLPEGISTEAAIATLEQDSRVAYAAPNDIYELDTLAGATRPDDMGRKLWALEQIHAPEAWSTSHGSRNGPIVAVLDTGIDCNHPDLKANLWTNTREIPGNGIDDDGNGVVDDVHGIFPKENNGNIQDKNGHGTHTAGTIGAVGNNGSGITGINWEAQIMAIRIFDDKGRTDVAQIARGLEYAAQNGARITSSSWGGTESNRALQDAFQSCPSLHIAACGNSHLDTDIVAHYPSAFEIPNMIAVAASDQRDRLASFSNYGASSVDLAAPGVDIYSTFPKGKYKSEDGTSMACPHVSGVAALVATAFPQASNEEIRQRILDGVDKVPALSGVVASGGRLNAAKALKK